MPALVLTRHAAWAVSLHECCGQGGQSRAHDAQGLGVVVYEDE